MYRFRRIGRRRFRLHADGFPYFHPAGIVHGKRNRFSLQYGAGRTDSLRRSIYVSVLLIGTVTLILNIAVFVWIHPILRILQIPKDIYGMMYDYLWIIFWGIGFTFIYNFYAALLRAIGDAVTPLWFLAVSVVLNIGLDLFFILQLDWGIKGAAIATVAAQEYPLWELWDMPT